MKLGSKKLWWTAFIVLITLVIIAFSVLSLPAFGGNISGERLERVQANPQYQDGSFKNVKPQSPYSFSEVGSFFTESLFYDEVRIPRSEIPLIPVTASSLEIWDPLSLRAFWIGHASVYVEIDGIRMLIDPVFSDYASPFDFGPKRFHPPPIPLQDLPKIDAVVISHDHYDHLDMQTIIHLSKSGTQFYVPLGLEPIWRSGMCPKVKFANWNGGKVKCSGKLRSSAPPLGIILDEDSPTTRPRSGLHGQ